MIKYGLIYVSLNKNNTVNANIYEQKFVHSEKYKYRQTCQVMHLITDTLVKYSRNTKGKVMCRKQLLYRLNTVI